MSATISHFIGCANRSCLLLPPATSLRFAHQGIGICNPKCSPTSAPYTSNTPVGREFGSAQLLPPPSPPHLSTPKHRHRQCEMVHCCGIFCLTLSPRSCPLRRPQVSTTPARLCALASARRFPLSCLLRNILPQAPAVITGFFPSYYGHLLLHHHTVACDDIGEMATTLFPAAEPSSACALGDYRLLP